MRKTTGGNRRSWSCARLYDARRAHDMLAGLVQYNMLDNFFTTHHIPLQIDGNYGIAAAVIDMLVQSRDGVVHLLPALSPQWEASSTRGVKARGNLTVAMSRRNHKVTQWKLTFPAPVPVEILVNGERKRVVPERTQSPS